jgi:hypothetical protein
MSFGLDGGDALHRYLAGGAVVVLRFPRACCGVIGLPEYMLGFVVVLFFRLLAFLVQLVLSSYLGIFFVRGLPHYLVSFGRIGFIYKAGRKPVSRRRDVS